MSNRFNDIDLAITDDGDLVLDGNGDLATVSNLDYTVQMITNRLMSIDKDWFYDNIGANIEESIGKPNTREVGEALKERIINCLTVDSFCTSDDLLVMVTPINSTSLVVGIFVDTEFQEDPLEFLIELNFLTGFQIKRNLNE